MIGLFIDTFSAWKLQFWVFESPVCYEPCLDLCCCFMLTWGLIFCRPDAFSGRGRGCRDLEIYSFRLL